MATLRTPRRSAATPARARRAKRGYHHGDLRNALIDTALAHIAAEGAYSLSLREVARRAGVSHTASYRHFPRKESLLAAIAEEGFVMLSDAMSAAMQAHSDDPLAALQAAGIAYVEFGVHYPHHLQLMFGGMIARRDDHPALKQTAEGTYELLREAVRSALHAARLDPTSERIVALAAWSLVHGLAQLIVGGRIDADGSAPPARYLATEVTRLLQQALLASPKQK